MQLKSTNTVKNTVAPNLLIINIQMWASVPMQKIQTDLYLLELLSCINLLLWAF